ncbi:MAG: hypothetical protein ACOCWT_06495 [Desulfohalobiaceae bacterium]
MVELQGLSGPAAVAIQKSDPKCKIADGVAMLGIVKGDSMVTLSPVALNIRPGTAEFERLKEVWIGLHSGCKKFGARPSSRATGKELEFPCLCRAEDPV